MVSAESLLQLVLMADASDETMRFIRYNDDENYDPAELEDEAMHFVERITGLFEHGLAFKTGYTRFMCEMLDQPMVFFLRGIRSMLAVRMR